VSSKDAALPAAILRTTSLIGLEIIAFFTLVKTLYSHLS